LCPTIAEDAKKNQIQW